MFNKFRFEVLIRNKSEVDQPRPLPPPRPGLPGSLPSAHNGEMLESAQTGLPPVQGLPPSVFRGKPSGQTGLAPPQDGVLPSEQGPPLGGLFGFWGVLPSEQTGEFPSLQVGGPRWGLGGRWGLEPSAQAGLPPSEQGLGLLGLWARARVARPRRRRRDLISGRTA